MTGKFDGQPRCVKTSNGTRVAATIRFGCGREVDILGVGGQDEEGGEQEGDEDVLDSVHGVSTKGVDSMGFAQLRI